MRAVAACPVPIVSAVGHEQDTPLCDLAADVRASTPTAAGRLVVPDLAELRRRVDEARAALHLGARRTANATARRLTTTRDRLQRAPLLGPRAQARRSTPHARLAALSPVSPLRRGYAIVRGKVMVVRSTEEQVGAGDSVRVDVVDGSFGATVD